MKKTRMKMWMTVGCMALLLITLFACGPKLPQGEESKKPQEPFDASSVESVKQFYNYYAERLAKQMEQSSGNEGASLTDVWEDLSFSIDQFSSVGDPDTAPDLLILRDRTLFIAGKEYDDDGEAVAYSAITKLYDAGSAQINRYGDEVSVTLNTNTGTGTVKLPDMQKVLGALPLGAEDISALQEEKVYQLEQAYITRLAEALEWTDEDVASLGVTLEQFCKLTFTLDLSDHAEKGTVTLTVSGKALEKAIVLTLDLSEYGEETGKITLSLDLPAAKLQAELSWKDTTRLDAAVSISVTAADMSMDIHYSCDRGAQPLPKDTPIKDCNTTAVSATVKVKGEEQLVLTLNAAALEGDRYAGGFALTVPSSAIGGEGSLLPLSLATLDNAASGKIEVEGSFDVGVDGKGALATLNSEMTAKAEGTTISVQLQADLGNAKKKGSEVARLQLTYAEPQETEETMLFTLTTQSVAEGSAAFSLVGTMTDEGEEETLTATLHWPAKQEIPLQEKEDTYLSRADGLFEHYDSVMKKIDTLNERAIEYVQNKMQGSAPLKYYCYDTATQQYLFTDITVSGGQIYVNTNCVLDYEELLFFYARHDGFFTSYTDSEAMKEAQRVQTLIEKTEDGYSIYSVPTYLVSQYLPDKGLYLVMFAGSPSSAVFYTERVTQEMVSDYVLHEITVLSDGTAKIHDFELRYDANCQCHLTCKDCGFAMSSVDPVHAMSAEIEIRAGGGESRVTFCACEHCGEGYLTMTDQEGNRLKVLLSSAQNASMEGAEEHGDKAVVISGFEHGSPDRVYQGTLNIPDIEPQTGYRIVGAVQGKTLVSSLPKVLVLPEGVEYIGRFAFYGCGFTSITLPSTVKIIAESAFAQCRATEIVIPENVTVVGSDAFSMSTLEKLTVNARRLEIFYLPYSTPALKEIIFNGEVEIFIGSQDCPIETLVIPKGVTAISGFSNNRYLKKIVLPSTLTTIESNAFMECSALQVVVLPEGLQTIGDAAFSGCTSLSCVWVAGNGVTAGEEGRVILPDAVNYMGMRAFARCSAMQSVRIPASIYVVPSGAFERCEQLGTVEMHDDITLIGTQAFNGCTSLSDIQMPQGLITIGGWAFSNCPALTDENVVFGSSLQAIEDRAFEKCTGIRNIRLPESVTSVHSNAFSGCQLDTVYVASKIAFSVGYQCWGADVNEITLAKGFTGHVPAAKTVNIMSTEVPEGSPHVVDTLSSTISVINFAGTQEAWEKGNYRTDPATQINFNVVFDEESNE